MAAAHTLARTPKIFAIAGDLGVAMTKAPQGSSVQTSRVLRDCSLIGNPTPRPRQSSHSDDDARPRYHDDGQGRASVSRRRQGRGRSRGAPKTSLLWPRPPTPTLLWQPAPRDCGAEARAAYCAKGKLRPGTWPLTSTLQGRRQRDLCEFEASMSYRGFQGNRII